MVYVYPLSAFPNNKVNSDRLIQEISVSSITIALDHLDTDPIQASIYFKSILPDADKSTLDSIIANHSGQPLPDAITVQNVKVVVEQPKYIDSGNVTQELFCAESIIVDVSAGIGVTIKDFSWPFNIGLKSGTLFISDDMIGDEITIKIAPNTLVGALISNMNVGDTSILVSPTVIQNIKYGQYVGLYSTQHELGRVINIGSNYLTITPAADISANAGSPIAMCAKIIPYAFLSAPGIVEIGKTISTANRIPANTKIRVQYTNNSGTAKRVSFFIEYIY